MTAHAPYNFVRLPHEAIPSEDLTPHDRYHEGLYSGYFDVHLTNKTPLYTRGMLSVDRERDNEKRRNAGKDPDIQPAFFEVVEGKPCIPGSSLRGMLRSVFEMVTFSKIQPTSQQPIFFRAVAADKNEPLGDAYRDRLGKLDQNTHAGKYVEAGFIQKDKNGNWLIRPARRFNKSAFGLVKDQVKKTGYVPVEGVDGLTRFNDKDYLVQVHPVRYEERNGRVSRVYSPQGGEKPTAYLVCTGNMLETNSSSGRSPRGSYALVMPPDSNAHPLPIPETVLKDYRDGGLTPFLKEAPFDNVYGALQEHRPIFYTFENEMVTGFGHTPNFRVAHLAWTPTGLPIAKTPQNVIPSRLKDAQHVSYDYSEAVFGYVRNDEADPRLSAYAGRISVTSATLTHESVNPYEGEMSPKILGTPQPTTFQHYLEQKPAWERTPKAQLTHYGSPNAQIRGHKLYWRQKLTSSADIAAKSEDVKDHVTQYTRITPLKPNQEFQFRVYFENLSEIELGALAWTLSLDGDHDAHHMLGMAKPYGMGVVKLSPTLHLSDRHQRYSRLFDDQGNWATGYSNNTDQMQVYIKTFKAAMPNNFDGDSRIQELKTMLKLYEPSPELTYMTIEPNEYADRPVLPLPETVAKRLKLAK